MKKILFFASSNKNKIKEVKLLLEQYDYEIKSLLDLPEIIEIIENGKTYQENATIKVHEAAKYVDWPIIADDSGLEIEALENFPGIYSNRWKGEMPYYQAMQVIIDKLKNQKNRKAKMVTYIVYYDPVSKVTKDFFGILKGEIVEHLTEEKQDNFGYDQIFYVPEKGKTLYVMGTNEKNKISHRYKAFLNLIDFLKTI